MGAYLKKFTAALLALSMLIQGGLPLRAEPNSFAPDFESSSQDSDKLLINTKFAALGNTLSFAAFKYTMNGGNIFAKTDDAAMKALYFDYKKSVVAEEEAVSAAYAHINKAHKYGPKSALNVLKKGKNQKGEICDSGKCFDETIYNRALLRAFLRYGAGLGESNKKWRWNREIMLEYAKNIYFLLNDYGASANDTAFAQKYLRYLIEKTGDWCDNDVYMADIMPGLAGGGGRADARIGKERRKNYCEKMGYAALSLALLENLSAQDSDFNARLLYKQLKDNYREDYGAMVLGNYVTALLMTGTNTSFSLLEKFLLKDSLADGLRVGGVWQILGRAFDIISIKAWVDKFTDANNKLRGRGGRYLNEVGLRFQYIDEDAARSFGFSSFSVSLAKDGVSGYNMPYGNILEDLGELVAMWPDKRALKIADKAVNNYAYALRKGDAGYAYAHTPFVAGAIKSGRVKSYEAAYTVNKLYSLDWWDLNEGTQRRVNNLAAKVSRGYGAGYKAEKTKDAVKAVRAARNKKISELAVWGDILVSAVLMTSFVISIPSLAKGASSFIKSFSASRSLRAARIAKIRAAGKGNLLHKVSSGKRVPAAASTVKTGAAKPAGAKPRTAAPAPKESPAAAKGPKVKKSETLSSVAKKRRAADRPANPASPKKGAEPANQTVTGQVSLSEQAGQNITDMSARPENLTVSIGEGSGGGIHGGASAQLTREQRLLRAKIEAEQELRLAQEVIELSKPFGPQKPFKGGWFFNKPYKELPAWKRFAFDNYFAWVLPSFDITAQTAAGAIRNPGKAVSGLSLSGAPAVNLFTPSVAIVQYERAPQTIANAAYLLKESADIPLTITRVTPSLTTVEAFSGALKTAGTAGRSANAGHRVLSILSLPRIEGVLNEFHGGNSGRLDNYRGRGFTPAAANYFTVSAETNLTAPIQSPFDIKAPAPVKKAEKGFAAFERFAAQILKKRSNNKANRARYSNLMSVAKYISPKLSAELIEIIDQNPYGTQTFDSFFEAVLNLLEDLQPGQIIALAADKIPSPRTAPLEDSAVANMLVIEDNPLEDVFDYVSSYGNFMVASALNRALQLPREAQDRVLSNLIDIALQKRSAGAPKKSYLIGVSGDAYEWEDFSKDDFVDLALGKEVKKDLIKELSIKKGRGDYKHFLSEYKDWLVSVLGATRETPAVIFENTQGTYFIYSHDGLRRIRIGGHELLLSRKVNYHFHLEYRNGVDGAWQGPLNYVYAWPNQNMLPSDLIRDMLENPVQSMKSRGVLIDKTDFDRQFRSNFILQAPGGGDADFISGLYLSAYPEKPASSGVAPFAGKFKGWQNALIPNMTMRGLSYVPARTPERQAFYAGIKKDLAGLFGREDYLAPWRKKLGGYDVSAYKNSTFSVITPSYMTGTAFFTEYLGMRLLLTNSHVVGKSKSVTLTDSDGEEFEADVIARTTERDALDLALLLPRKQSIFDGRTPLNLSLRPIEGFGGELYLMGYPGDARAFNKKAMLFIEQDYTGRYPALTAVPAATGGNSGGPLMVRTPNGDYAAGVMQSSSQVSSHFIPSSTVKSFLKKTVKLGLSNPEFDNNIFYGAGLFATRPSLRQMFTIDAGFWRQNLLEGGGKAVPGFGFTPGAKIESKYMPVILTPNK